MLNFRAPRIEDREWVTRLIISAHRESCEYCFGNVFIWSPVYGTEITRFEDYFITCGAAEDGMYCFPMGQGDLRCAIEAVRADASERGRQVRFFGVTEEDKALLELIFPGRFDFEEDRSFFDYIYRQSDLALLKGKKYHAKRNHITAFERDGDWNYEPINSANMADCMRMNEAWVARNMDKNPVELANEQQALNRAFAYYDKLGFRGGLLRKSGETVAFTIGEPMGTHMFCTHFEKAYADVRGAYPMINREFAVNALSDFSFINREEDTGDEGLRKAKLSYCPYKLLKKYEAICKD